MSDLIDRQVAIDALDCINGTEEVLRSLPSVQPERKTGRWIRSGNKLVPYYCSSCTGRFDYEWKFCPNCGAKMRGE